MKTPQDCESAMHQLIQQIESCPWTDKKFYGDWLAQSHYYTRYSTRLLAFAAGLTDQDEQGYYRRSLQHIREEQGHDQIAINDLKKLELNLSQFEERGATRALWEPQFYKIQRSSVSLLGYILALEELAVKTFAPLYGRLIDAYPKEACYFVKVHADDDPDHVEEALRQIETSSLKDRETIFANYRQTCDLYRFMLTEISV